MLHRSWLYKPAVGVVLVGLLSATVSWAESSSSSSASAQTLQNFMQALQQSEQSQPQQSTPAEIPSRSTPTAEAPPATPSAATSKTNGTTANKGAPSRYNFATKPGFAERPPMVFPGQAPPKKATTGQTLESFFFGKNTPK